MTYNTTLAQHQAECCARAYWSSRRGRREEKRKKNPYIRAGKLF
jgi:hypothetical protein